MNSEILNLASRRQELESISTKDAQLNHFLINYKLYIYALKLVAMKII